MIILMWQRKVMRVRAQTRTSSDDNFEDTKTIKLLIRPKT